MVTDLHTIIAQLAPSDEQRPAVVARGSDVAVTAGAGAGKTRTLVARYLSLLADGVPLRGIVAITFTKKAAREMRTRVRQEIRQYLQTEGLPDAERLRWSDHYEGLDAARIGTIHSLCADLLRHHPAAVGIDPRFDMLDEGQMALLQAQAVAVALGWASDSVEAAPLFDLFGDVGLGRVLSSMLAKRLDVADAWARIGNDPWGVWNPILVAPIRGFLDDASVQAGFSELLALRHDGALARAAAAGDALAPDLVAALEHIDAIAAARAEGDWAGVSRRLAPLRGCLKQKGRQANWAPATPKATISCLQARYDESLAPLVGKGIDLDLDRHLVRAVVPALMAVFEQARDAYDRAKAQRQALDFDDLEATALRLLEESPEARAYWQQEIRALLVDEFQDTNERQRVLLQALNGAQGKLFIVGDAKQSIYRFRGADVTVFRAEREEIAAHGQGLDLVTSYRAHRAMVEALNTLLRPVLGEQDDPQRPYVEPFSELAHYRDAPAAGLHSPYVELHLAVGPKTGGALDRAAQALVVRLADLVERGEVTLPDRGEGTGAETMRHLSYGDVAILCRASTAFPVYENALEQAGIPYLTIAGRGFYNRPEVRDVLNALRGLADPTDDLALAGLLRSPAFGLSDMALYQLRTGQCAAARASLWKHLLVVAASPAALSDLGDETPRAAHAAALIGRLHQMVGRTPVADVLKAFLDATAYRAILLRTGAARATANIDKLLSDAHASGIVSVDAFVEYLAELRDVASREGEARSLATGAVQIMSVHQAKGLEFPIVVIGDASRSSPGGGGAFVLDRALGIVPHMRAAATQEGEASSLAYALAQRREEDQEAAESDRLLYVAATRVRELLLISGTVSVTRSGGLSLAGWLKRLDPALGLTAQAPACADAGDAVRSFVLPLGSQNAQCTLYEPEALLPPVTTLQRMAQGAEQALPDHLRLLEPVAGLAAQADEATDDTDRDPPRRVWLVVPRTPTAGAPAWVVGELVHLALRDWAFPDGDDTTDFYAWSAAEARTLGLTDEARIGDAVRRAARMLTRFQTTDLYEAMDSATQRLAEVPYSILDGDGRIDTGVIDALYLYEGAWSLVEFKTDALKDADDLDTPPHITDYRDQVARYVFAAGQLLGERPRPVLCYLNCGGRVHLVTDRWSTGYGSGR
ncbi:MAG: UvrD-helicase domain-containing protein [Anaerolineae bacterium]|nr:UvrD-helicase domain-containing protein [Anaerolineae bacterium]